MVNKRQRLARKQFRVESGLTSPNESGEKRQREAGVEATISGQSFKKVRRNPVQSEKNAASLQGMGSDHVRNVRDRKGNLKIHPMRVPGSRPGESCFLCKGKDHIAKFCPTKSAADSKKICLLCRQRGHTLKQCRQNPQAAEGAGEKVCYNCGDKGHRLADCPKPKSGGVAYAVCFICREKGHLSRDCPSNPHGVYPKGGCCKVCGGVTHLAKDCPEKGKAGNQVLANGGLRKAQSGGSASAGKHTTFVSGDDLEDDFEVAITGALAAPHDDDDDDDEEELETLETGDLDALEDGELENAAYSLEPIAGKRKSKSSGGIGGAKIRNGGDITGRKSSIRMGCGVKMTPKVVSF